MTVKIKFATLLIVSRFINIVILKLYSFSAGQCPAGYSYFLRREERSKEASTPSKSSPIWEDLKK
jgi:hypothetical protein